MWIIAKIKLKNLNTFKKELSQKIGEDLKFYIPKIEYHKYYGSKVKRFEFQTISSPVPFIGLLTAALYRCYIIKNEGTQICLRYPVLKLFFPQH